jgi:hypothetical protein
MEVHISRLVVVAVILKREMIKKFGINGADGIVQDLKK